MRQNVRSGQIIDLLKGLHVFHFPAYAPVLNPAEGLRVQVKEYTAGKAPMHIRALYRLV